MDSLRDIAYRKDVDGLRSLAILLVLIFHFKLLPIGKGGFLGVDIFFVISGFLITSIILKKLSDNTFTFKDFYLKRIRRLAPALFTVLLLVIVIGGFILLPSDYSELSKQLLATQLYSSNFYFWQNINYFGLKADSSPLLHTWSLAVEEQFYILYPFVVFLIFKYSKKYFWHWMLFGITLSFFLNIFFVETKPELTFYLMPTRAWELLCGGMLVFIGGKATNQLAKLSVTIGWVGLFLIGYSVLFYDSEILFPGYYALLPVVGTMLLILSGQHQRGLLYKIFSHDIPVYIGKISYPLYLVHWPIHVFATQILAENYNILWRVVMFSLSLLVSALMFRYIEKPIQRGLFVQSINKQFSYYFIGLVTTIGLFATVYVTDGFPSRFTEKTLKIASFTQDIPPPRFRACAYREKKTFTSSDFCHIGDHASKPKWLLFGDSHALAASNAFNLWLEKRGESALFIYRHGCVPLKGVDLFKSKGQCLNFNKNIYNFIESHSEIRNVAIVSTWSQVVEGLLTKSSGVKLNIKQSMALFDKQFSSTMVFLKSSGKSTYLWAPVPTAKGNVPKRLALSEDFDKTKSKLEYSEKEYFNKFQFFFSALAKSKGLIHRLFSPAKELCGSGKCSVFIEGKPVYSDSGHISYSTSSFWANVLEKQSK